MGASRAYLKKWREDNPTRVHGHRLKQYGLSVEAWHALLLAQSGRCDICTRPFDPNRSIHVDHDHGTGKVRGLLCRHCNLGLGHFREDTRVIKRAIFYLREHRRAA